LEGPPDAVYWYVLQTYSAAEIAFKRFVRLFPRSSWDQCFEKKPNESERTVFLAGNRQVHFKSGQNFEDLRAETLHGCIIDECRQQNESLWRQIVRPMLGRHKGWCDFYSTPNGFDWFYDLYQSAQGNDEWAVFHSPSTACFWWTETEIESTKKTMSEAEFAQEIRAEFRDLTRGKAYKNYSQQNHSTHNPLAVAGLKWNPMLPIHVGMDFNLSPMAWTLAQKRHNRMHFEDEVWIQRSDTAEAALVLCDKVSGHKPGIILVGDSTSRAGQRAAAGKSDYDILCEVLDFRGIKWTNLTPSENPRVKDRVNTVNARLRSASGEVFVTVNPESCPMLHRDFERVAWKVHNDGVLLDQKTDPMLTHSSDGAGYLICQVLPIDSASEKVGGLQVLYR